MSVRLLRDQVAAHVEALRRTTTLTALQSARLDAVVDTLADDGRFLLRDALDAGEFTGSDARAQDAFQDFRQRVNKAAAAAAIELSIELDTRKEPPDRRHGWFTGGELVDEGIATFTEKAAQRTGITHPVTQSVADLRHASVYVSFADDDARWTDEVLRELTQTLALDGARTWDISDTNSVHVGEDPDAVRDRLCADADVRVALVSTTYLTGDARERDRVCNAAGPLVTFALGGLPDAPLAGSLRAHDIDRRRTPWAELAGKAKRVYIGELADALRRVIDPRRTAAFHPDAGDEPLVTFSSSTATRQRAGDSHRVVTSAEATETSLSESHLAREQHRVGVPAVERLITWAQDPTAPRLCALLGDVGMGKTTTAKLFTQGLLTRRASDPTLPLPILFDLRDARVADLTASMTTDHILASMLDAGRPATVGRERLTADVVRRRVDQGNTVVVFDGLDEVLVHLSQHDQQLFTRQLWRAVEPASGSKLLLTCRSQYFRTIRDETTYFTAEGREGLHGENYLALLMLPFREDQVREYLTTNLGRDAGWVDGFLATIATVHDLPDLSRRPVTLRMIADQVDVIESAKFAGRELQAIDLYREFVDRWLARDEAKRVLTREHKHLLMEEIAAGLWRSGRNSWRPDQVDDWLLDLLERRPDLQRRYRGRVPELLAADFRTATFLCRREDTFSFGHRSLAEYFLACYLGRALNEGDRAIDAWAMPVPNLETLDFLGQLLTGLPSGELATALSALARISGSYQQLTSELALAYALGAARRGHPHQSLVGVQLPGAQLEGWRFGTDADDVAARAPLMMTGANLVGAALRRARFDRVDLTGADFAGADLTVAEFHTSRLAKTRLSGARLISTILRDCAIGGVEHGDADAFRAELLRCTPTPPAAPGWLVAPGGARRPDVARLRALFGHSGSVLSVAWSSDGTRLATASTDGSARVWDTATGHTLLDLTGHTSNVWSVAWSPDGTRLATASDDGSARMWDTATGQPIGPRIVLLPSREVAVFDAVTNELTGATDGAWRWLGWNVIEDGRLTRLPAETYGLLPPLHQPVRTAVLPD